MTPLRSISVVFICVIILNATGVFISCKTGDNNVKESNFEKLHVDINHPFSFTMEFPITSKGTPSYLYTVIQRESTYLKLDSLQKGYDSLQIRIWFGNSSDSLNRIVVIKKSDRKYTASLISYGVINNGQIANVNYRDLLPKSGWQTLMNSLIDFKILTLPHMSNIPGFNVAWADGELYAVELATKNRYRFYYYWCPEMLEDKYWQAGNLKGILETLNSEFSLDLYEACK